MAHRTRTGPSDEDDGVEPRIAWRVGLWLLVAVSAATALVSVARTEAGSRRLYAVLDELTVLSAFPLALRLPASSQADTPSPETERLASSVRQLTADRDRLSSRLEALERAEATGSIPASRQAAPVLAEATESEPPATMSMGAAGSDVGIRTEFAVDLGATANLDAMRGLWLTLKAKHGAAFEGLRPLASIRENGSQQGIALHLVAGPVANVAAAARLCVALVSMGERCEPTTFDGQRLALR